MIKSTPEMRVLSKHYYKQPCLHMAFTKPTTEPTEPTLFHLYDSYLDIFSKFKVSETIKRNAAKPVKRASLLI